MVRMIITGIKIGAFLFALIAISTIGHGQKYYKRVIRNVAEFNLAFNHIYGQNMFKENEPILLNNGEVVRYDSIQCLFPGTIADSSIKLFIQKYDIKRICLSREKHGLGDSVITFHKDFNPLWGKAVVIIYDFGKSELREKIKKGIRERYENVKVINDLFLYRESSRPAFGY